MNTFGWLTSVRESICPSRFVKTITKKKLTWTDIRWILPLRLLLLSAAHNKRYKYSKFNFCEWILTCYKCIWFYVTLKCGITFVANVLHLSRNMKSPTMWYVRPAKAQVILYDSNTILSEFLSLKWDCTGSSESILVKIPYCWNSNVAAHSCLTPATLQMWFYHICN